MTPSPYTPNSIVSPIEDPTLTSSDISTYDNQFGFAPLDEEASDELFVVSTYTDFSKLGEIMNSFVECMSMEL